MIVARAQTVDDEEEEQMTTTRQHDEVHDLAKPERTDYAPYHTFPAFEHGVRSQGDSAYDNPYHNDSANAQAWDRGLEYAMRCARWPTNQSQAVAP
jgi:hypothetical protein